MKNIIFFLKEINIQREKSEARKEAEDNFNLFSILVHDRKEENLHSRFISVLLDPNGPHKLGTKFLDLFIDTVESKFEYTTQTLTVRPNFTNSSEYRDIDIYINSSSHSIIIENKVGAEDSNHEERGQLEKYYEEALEDGYNPENIEIFYLTHDGHSPSEKSVNTTGKHPELKEKVHCITYEYEILNWLKECAKESYDKPILRESINQYIKLVQEMTNNDMQIEERKTLTELIGKNEDNLKSAKYLIDNFKHVQWHTIYDFWKELTEVLANKGYTIVRPVDDRVINLLVHGGPIHKKQDFNLYFESSKQTPIAINCDYRDSLCYGISNPNSKFSKSIKDAAKNYTLSKKTEDSNSSWPYWCYFESEGCDIVFSNFSKDSTFNLISPNNRKQVIERIVNEIKRFVLDFEKLIK